MSQLDLVIRGGSIVDGTGAAAKTADIGVTNGEITEVGKISSKGKQEIDASGALVTPGFVDIHTHYDGQATWSNRMSPSSNHGVTTVVMGNCGVGFAPCWKTDHNILIELMEGVEDIPGAALNEGLSWEWESFPEYMDYLDKRQFDMDIGAQLPHAAMRVFVMGERGANREPATADDIAKMRQLTAEAMQAGAIGFSSSRTINHRSSKGAHTPSLTAESQELVGIAQGIKDAGKGVIEMISDFDDIEEEFANLEAMMQTSNAAMSISLAQGISPHGWKKLMSKIEAANSAGMEMRGQVATRGIGILMGYSTTLNPFLTRPSYMEVAGLPLAERVIALRDPARKAKILAEQPSRGFDRMFTRMADGKKLWDLGDPPNYEPTPEESLYARGQAEGRDPWELTYELLLENDGKTILYSPFANYADGDLEACREMIMHEHTIMGLGDGGAHVGTICDASFATTQLAHWGRDRSRGSLIALPHLVKTQTRDTARAVGLNDRGELVPGQRADINIIDFENLRVRAPEMVYDLPSGAGRLQQQADGYLATIVKGMVTYEKAQPTDNLPGRLIRGAT
ncbi:MAG: amidohydrolase family protein [Pseudomonadales bacterium]|nr:amidohydrolase family protein [Pseudomonadales bacterium]